jgi:magnesium transporter
LEHLIEISLDSVRNQLMRMNMGVAITTLGFSAGSFAASLFGMNLMSGFEHHPHAFYYVTCGIAVTASVLYLGNA